MIFELLVPVVPLVCWLLAAPPGRVRLVIAAVLGAAAAAAYGSVLDVLPDGVRWTALVAAGGTAVAALLLGLLLVWPVHRGEHGERRGTGAALSVGCALLLGTATWFGGGLLASFGAPLRVPAAAEVAPLPDGLRITADRDTECGGGSTTYCIRELTVDGPPDTPDRLRAHLTATGWPLARDRDGWHACRRTGALLDVRTVCLDLPTTAGPAVTLTLSSDDRID
ncbi:hypothetical protein ACIQBJ_03655 [Kitasatospora sp. NPDC088391]|uniref:hypothetical protein n=1 Tax=Kitasatospora sp. NPDC088391 TaxID=3364074 RepID=UPI00381E5A0D